jgi:hypothetical protein
MSRHQRDGENFAVFKGDLMRTSRKGIYVRVKRPDGTRTNTMFIATNCKWLVGERCALVIHSDLGTRGGGKHFSSALHIHMNPILEYVCRHLCFASLPM